MGDGVLVAKPRGNRMSANRVTPEQLRNWPSGKSLLALTAYDYPVARILDEAGVDLIHVGQATLFHNQFPQTELQISAELRSHASVRIRLCIS